MGTQEGHTDPVALEGKEKRLLSDLLRSTPIATTSATQTTDEMTINKSSDPKRDVEELLAEYDQLRKAINHNDAITLQILTFIILLTSALMGFAFSQQVVDNSMKAALFLLVQIFAFIGLTQNADRMKSTYILGSYIKTFIEPKTTNIRWETRLFQFRSVPKRYDSVNLSILQSVVYGIIILTNFFLCSYYFAQAYNTIIPPVVVTGVMVIGLMITILLLLLYYRNYILLNRKHTSTFDAVWRKIKEDENKIL